MKLGSRLSQSAGNSLATVAMANVSSACWLDELKVENNNRKL